MGLTVITITPIIASNNITEVTINHKPWLENIFPILDISVKVRKLPSHLSLLDKFISYGFWIFSLQNTSKAEYIFVIQLIRKGNIKTIEE